MSADTASPKIALLSILASFFVGYFFNIPQEIMKWALIVPGIVLMNKFLSLPPILYLHLTAAIFFAFGGTILVALTWPDASEPYRFYVFAFFGVCLYWLLKKQWPPKLIINSEKEL